ncbi:MAG: hypothetical protein M1118_11755, partial [Chloroflexi bacterium]|nr:hypothetical protein [Chloroflexota bacterium]
AVSPTGAVTGFLLGPAGTQERWLAEYLLCWRSDPNSLPWQKEDLPPSNKRNSSDYVGPKGPIWPSSGVGKLSAGPYVADSNFSDAIWIEHWKEDYGASVLTTKEYQGEGADQIKRQHARWRQVVETTFDHLQEVFSLPLPGSRSRWGLLATVAAKLAALNLGILLSRQFGRQDLALATLFVF